jgi:hypothetical protein
MIRSKNVRNKHNRWLIVVVDNFPRLDLVGSTGTPDRRW